MIRYLLVLTGVAIFAGLFAFPVVALEGTVSPELESVQSVFCLNSTTGESVPAMVTTDAEGVHGYDCGELTGATGDAISILIQGSFVAPPALPPPPQGSNCAELFAGGVSLSEFSCEEDLPDNNLGTVQAGLTGDVYTFQASASSGGEVVVDTTDRGDGMSNLAPSMILLGPNGEPIDGSIDEVNCTFPPACGSGSGRCPRLSGMLDLPGIYQLIVLDTPAVGLGCTGGGYRITTTTFGGVTFVEMDDDANTGLTGSSAAKTSSR